MDVNLQSFINENMANRIRDSFQDIDSHVFIVREAFDLCTESNLEAVLEQLAQVLVKRVWALAHKVEIAYQKLEVGWSNLSLGKFSQQELRRWLLSLYRILSLRDNQMDSIRSLGKLTLATIQLGCT